jgi:ketosteroid isomerase-like protein
MKFLITLLLLMNMNFLVYPADLDKERAAILEIDKQWASAAAEGRDVERIISFWSDDAKIFAPGMSLIEGKTAIRQFVQNGLATPGFSIRWNTIEVVVSRDGSMAYATGTNRTTLNDPQGKKVRSMVKQLPCGGRNQGLGNVSSISGTMTPKKLPNNSLQRTITACASLDREFAPLIPTAVPPSGTAPIKR